MTTKFSSYSLNSPSFPLQPSSTISQPIHARVFLYLLLHVPGRKIKTARKFFAKAYIFEGKAYALKFKTHKFRATFQCFNSDSIFRG